jgi:aspartate kinase
MVVQKFGGTSVADPDAIRRLIDIVRTARAAENASASGGASAREGALEGATIGGTVGAGPAVVVSAMSGVTDALLKVAAEAGASRLDAALAGLTALRTRHLAAVDALVDASQRAALVAAMGEHFEQLDAVVKTIATTGETSPRVLDVVASAGELLNSRLVAAAFVGAGLPGVWVDARKVVVTNGEYTRAIPLAAETDAAMRAHVRSQIDAGKVPVLGGFVGATTDGHTTTLGRGGSDYSGALVGAGIGAREIQIWTDVDGMLTADPRVVASPRLVPSLSFAEAAELAYFGAKVLHPSTILPAIEHDIPVRILNSRKPQGTGTVITATGTPNGTPVTAFACKRGVTVVDITSSRMLMAYGFLRRVFEVFEQYRTAVDVVTTSEVSVSVTVDDTRDLDAIVTALRAFGEVSVEGDMALLCAVGDHFRSDPHLAARVVGVLEEVPLRMISQAASRRNITVIMRQADLQPAMQRVHAEFFE